MVRGTHALVITAAAIDAAFSAFVARPSYGDLHMYSRGRSTGRHQHRGYPPLSAEPGGRHVSKLVRASLVTASFPDLSLVTLGTGLGGADVGGGMMI